MSLSMLLAAKGADADTTIYFVNIYAGPEIFELDGHAAIVVDIKGQPSRSYNFGVFDFDAPPLRVPLRKGRYRLYGRRMAYRAIPLSLP